MNIIRSDSFKKGIVFSTTFNLVAKLIGFANSLVIAYYFGAQAKTDIYFYSVATIALIITFVTSLNHSVLIPESIRIREQESEKNAQQFLTFFLYLYLALGIIFIGILFVSPVHSFSTISKFNIAILENNIEILHCVIPLCVLMLITTYLTDILASYKYFTLPMIASSINSLLSLFFVILFHSVLDVRSILLGITLGYVLNLCILFNILHFKLHWIFSFNRIRLQKRVFRNIFYAQAGNIFSLLSAYVPLYLLSGFKGGIITALNYGKNLSDIPNQMITSQFSVVSGIKFNELAARKEYNQLNEIFLSTTRLLLFLLTPISGLFFLFSEDIVSIIYLRGAFNANSVLETALFLKYFGMLLPLLAINTMTSRIFMATQKINYSFVYQIVTNLFFLVLLFLFVRIFGIIGYPIAQIVMYLISAIAIYLFLKLTIKDFKYLQILYYFLFIILINAFSTFVVFKFKISNFFPNTIALILGTLLYMIIIILINEVFCVNKHFKLKQIWNIKSIE